MLGHSHAVSGLLVGAGTLPVAPVHGFTEQVAWVAAWGGMAMLPDLDQRGATVGRLWGPLTAVVATGIGKVARGHRNGTHDAILAPLVFGSLAAAAPLHPWVSLTVLAFAIGIALKACHFAIPGQLENTWLGNLALSWGGAWWLTEHGTTTLPWLPLAVAGGVLVHIAGDALTVGGCPVPFTWMDGKTQRYSLRLFRTGAAVETWVIAPALMLAAGWLLYANTGLYDFGEAVRQAWAAR